MRANHWLCLFNCHLKKSHHEINQPVPNLTRFWWFQTKTSRIIHVTGGRVSLSSVWTEPRCSQVTDRGGNWAQASLCDLTPSQKMTMSFLLRTISLAAIRLALLKYRRVVFNHPNLAVFDLRWLNSHESNNSRLLFNPSMQVSKPLIKRCSFFPWDSSQLTLVTEH